MQTNFNTVIGGYNPDQWEDTTGMKTENNFYGTKHITSGKPFLFYWLNDQIQIIKHRDDRIPSMESNKDYLMKLGGGLSIIADKNDESEASAYNFYYKYP